MDNLALASQQTAIRMPTASEAVVRAPRSLEELGLPFNFLVQLVTKILHRSGQQKIAELVAHSKISCGVLATVLEYLRRERRCEVVQGGVAANMRFVLTETGHAAAEEYLRANPYIGPAPVTLAAYNACVQRQAAVVTPVTRADMQRVFGASLSDRFLDQLGAAVNSGRALYLYGPAGSGKTYVAERLGEVLRDAVLVPHAVLVEGQAVRIFDSTIHTAVAAPAADAGDGRWVICKRPVVVVGSELTLQMLDVGSAGERASVAPLHVKANNGMLVIDDFGRQPGPMQPLVNRLTGPLERRTDYLGSNFGDKARCHVDVRMVFCADAPAGALVSDAFARRLAYKVAVEPLTDAHFGAVWRQTSESFGLANSAGVEAYVIARLRRENRALLASTPRALLSHVLDQARYLDQPARVDEEAIDRIWDAYFSPAQHA